MAPYNVPISLQATMSQFPSTSFQAQSTTIALKSFGYCFASDNSPVPSHYTVLQGQHLSACFDITFPESYTGAFSRSHRLRITDGSTLLVSSDVSYCDTSNPSRRISISMCWVKQFAKQLKSPEHPAPSHELMFVNNVLS